MQITLYEKATGNLGPVMSGPSIEVLTERLRETVGWVEGAWDAETHKVDLETGEVIPVEP